MFPLSKWHAKLAAAGIRAIDVVFDLDEHYGHIVASKGLPPAEAITEPPPEPKPESINGDYE
jgi:hypothetical protein